MKTNQLTTISKHILMINDSLQQNQVYHNKHIDIDIFEQLWPNTAGGMSIPGQVSCNAMTLQRTYVIYNKELNIYHIFFDGLLAYTIKGNKANNQFFTDLKTKNLTNKGNYKQYIKKEEDN